MELQKHKESSEMNASNQVKAQDRQDLQCLIHSYKLLRILKPLYSKPLTQVYEIRCGLC